MSDERPFPLVPADVDLSKLDGFMLDTAKLLGSELVALSTGDEFKAAVILWCRAWKQRPAASLPNDDKILAAFAMVPLSKWRKVRDVALRGFIECGDSRLYHPVLAADAVRAHKAQKQRQEAIRKRWEKERAEETTVIRPNEIRTAPEQAPELPKTGQGRDGTEVSKSSDANASGAEAPGPLDLKREMWARGKAFLVSKGLSADEAGKMIGRWRKSASDTAIIDALARAEADCQGDVIEYVAGCLRGANGRGSQQAASAKTGLFTGFAIAASGRRPES